MDLVVCCKRRAGSHEHGRGSFHHVLGHDITSTASAAAYFAQLCSRQEHVRRVHDCLHVALLKPHARHIALATTHA